MGLLHSDKQLTQDYKDFTFNIYRGDGIGATHAFLTPVILAGDFIVNVR